MRLFNKLGKPLILQWLKKLNVEKHAVHFLNISQFLGVINDNVFKFLIVFLFIDLRGIKASSEILFYVGTVYVLPFLLFSSFAGVLADYFSKQKLIIILKAVEVGIMFLGIIAFYFQSEFASYSLLFLLSTQSAVFGPPKYSIIPELVPAGGSISKANGLITSSTYLAIIAGTFLASFLTQITDRNFVLTAVICLFVAILGYLASLFLPYTQPGRGKSKVNAFFVYDIYKTLKNCRKSPNLLLSVLGGAFFLFIGAFFQLNMIPFAIEALDLSEVGGGYLFLTIAIGIAIGAFLAGRLSNKKVELGIPCLAIIIMTLIIFFLATFSSSLIFVLFCLIIIGISGGLFIVPFETYIQTESDSKERGQVVAASNFLSFIGVLIAPFMIYLLSGKLGFTAAHSFYIVGIIVLIVAFFLLRTLRNFFFNYICRTILSPFYSYSVTHFPFHVSEPILLLFPNYTLLHLLILSAFHHDVHLYIPCSEKRWFHFFMRNFTTIHFIYTLDPDLCFRHYLRKEKEGQTSCLIFASDTPPITTLPYITEYVSVETLSKKEQASPCLFKKHLITLSLSSKKP
ncbi:MAG: MFS transporter [Simkaniaceae bacterium]|nr:MFS transporter [Simkaniaceae bacterium]